MNYLDYSPTNIELSFEIVLESWSKYNLTLKLSDNSLFQDNNDVWISPGLKLDSNLYTKD
ncbi:22259_t:CDS:2 [Dentiscutata erythropus]|uniref:22259_t:CDS:1 n=1 Tax=Dentiscutata erythropus TaxID=1348616 RepID=A0A9N8Z9G9_9GLOM|nr:22259_t:CDS:2 [Dentiscutata erythropus]